MQLPLDSELKWSDDDIRQLRDAVNHLVEINEELNAKVLTMDGWVKNGDAKIRLQQKYIQQLEWMLQSNSSNN
jgi:hypothetical protein